MEIKEEPIVLSTDNNAVKEITRTVYQSLKGNIFLTENSARYDSCTNTICECGGMAKKNWVKCDSCLAKQKIEIRNKLPVEEWDGVVMIFDESSDRYFSDMDEIGEYLADNDEDAEDLDLYLCTPNYVKEIDSSIWEDLLPPEDYDLPKELQEKLNEFNEFIRSSKIILSWGQSKVRTNYIP